MGGSGNIGAGVKFTPRRGREYLFLLPTLTETFTFEELFDFARDFAFVFASPYSSSIFNLLKFL